MSKNAHVDKTVRDYLIEKAKSLKITNSSFIDKRAATAAARDLLAIEQITDALGKTFAKGWACPPKYEGKRIHSPHKRIVNVLLSDTHFGAQLDPQECPLEYNTIQESRRLGRVGIQVADYKRQYRAETKLLVHLLGDIIQNQLHDPRDGAPLAMQFAAAVHYLTQLIMFWTAQFPLVEVYCASGNHGRNMARHPDRGVQQKFDSIETMIYTAVKTAVLNAGVTNCTFVIPKSPYYVAKLFDAKFFGTHGDTVLKPGAVGKSINVANLSQQIRKWNTARNVGGPFHIFACGHIHTPSITFPAGVAMITNGALVPTDAYSLSIGEPDNTCGQWLFESVEGHAIGDQRLILVDSADKDPKYNKIITPFEGL